MTKPDEALAAAAAAISAADTIVTTGHVHPDGDALGSALALALAARAAGKRAWATFSEPFELGHQFRFLDAEPIVPVAELPDGIELVVACDTANPERLGTALEVAEAAGTLVVVDHHVSNGGFGDIVVADHEAAATAQLMYYLVADHLGWPLDEAAATALYAGLVTDTGRFQYSATTPEVHRVAAALLAAGADPDRVARHVYGESPFGYLKVAGAVLSRSVLDADHRLVWSVVRRGDLEDAGIGYDDTDGLIDLIRLAEESEVACLLKETEPGVLKGSLRSRGLVDVNAVAAAFGGGGHRNAAGFTAAAPAEEIIARIVEML